MNIKTTIVLLVLLLGVGGYVFFTRDKSNPDEIPKHEEHTLLDIKQGLITSFSIKKSDGKEVAAAKSKDAGGVETWKLTQPVSAAAETYKIDSLLSTLTSLKSTEQVSSTGSLALDAGLDHPQYVVDLAQGGTDVKLTIGKELSLGDGVYVQVKGQNEIEVVPASLLEELKKPASSYRKERLFETAAPSVQQLTITHKDGSQLVMNKLPAGWEIARPVPTPADGAAVEDLASAVINMQPVEFVNDTNQLLGLSKPQAVVTFSTAAPSTQPATAPVNMAGALKVIFGGYDDVNMKNVFAQIPDGTIVKVPASVLDSLNKTPLDLRDKSVATIDPAQVTKLVIASHQPATTQPVAAAVDHVITLLRRPPEAPAPLGPPLPKTAGTRPTTAPATMPVAPVVPEVPKTVWLVDTGKPGDADDAKVTALLGQFHPLKAEKFLESPTTKPAPKMVRQFTITFFTGTTPPTVLTLVDPGSEANLIGSYNGLSFEVLRALATDLGGEFGKTASPSPPVPSAPPFR